MESSPKNFIGILPKSLFTTQLLMSMNTYKFIQLGPPPKQPRTSQFCPLSRKNGKKLLGKAEVVSMTKCDQNPNNIDILEQYGVLKREPRSSIKAGEVIIAAKPFVIVAATGSDILVLFLTARSSRSVAVLGELLHQ